MDDALWVPFYGLFYPRANLGRPSPEFACRPVFWDYYRYMPPEQQSARFTRIYVTLWGAVALVALIVFVFYLLGYRLGSGLEPVKAGSIEVVANEKELSLFLDGREQKPAVRDGTHILKNVTPGAHSILVSKDGFWPWMKTVEVAADAPSRLYAFIFQMAGVETIPLSRGSEEYARAVRGFAEARLPELSPASPPLSPDTGVRGWIEENAPARRLSGDRHAMLYTAFDTIYIAWISDTDPPPHAFCEENPCRPVMPIVVSVQPLTSVDFYRGRNDVILFAAGTSIYSIEVSREGTQNFQPLYKGRNPRFFTDEGGTVYITDGDTILRAAL